MTISSQSNMVNEELLTFEQLQPLNIYIVKESNTKTFIGSLVFRCEQDVRILKHANPEGNYSCKPLDRAGATGLDNKFVKAPKGTQVTLTQED